MVSGPAGREIILVYTNFYLLSSSYRATRHARRGHPNSGGIVVQRRRWLARAALLVGAGLLALVLVAATAVASPSSRPRRAERSSSSSRPTSTTSIPSSTICRAAGRSSTRSAASSSTIPTSRVTRARSSRPRPRPGAPIVSKDGKTYTFKIRPGHQVLDRRGGDGGELRERDQPDRLAGAAVAGLVLHRHHPGRRRSA